MIYSSLEQCLLHLEKHGMLLRIKQEVDPNLQMAEIHLRVHKAGGPAILFEKVKGTRFRAASNIFGTLNRSKFIFENQLSAVKKIIDIKNNPLSAIKKPLQNIHLAKHAFNALPKKQGVDKSFAKIKITDLPLIKHWPKDGGAFVTLPQVYTEDPSQPEIANSNLGMYRIQLNGNNYETNKEIGLHYQLHRGIGVHQSIAVQKNIPLNVSCFVGGPPAHTVAAVMPLPEGMSEMQFAGLLGGKRFNYAYDEKNNCISNSADFVITGCVLNNQTKPEGPFGDHLGYYSLQHNFPLMQVHNVYAKPNAIWPFTVVGRPPQEDTSFGQLIHELTGKAIHHEIAGLKEVNAVDAAGVHPLLLAIGSERYTPYDQAQQPSEILTIANKILGTGQLSLAKYLFITATDNSNLSTHNTEDFFKYIFERLHFDRDVHFYTNTSIDTLDYSGTQLNQGSKVVLSAYGNKIRELQTELPNSLNNINTIVNAKMCMPGVMAVQTNEFVNYETANAEMNIMCQQLLNYKTELNSVALIVLCNDSNFLSAEHNNFLWVTFTRSNPAQDIYGVGEFVQNKHWGCTGPLIIDARQKPHHAPVLEQDPITTASVDKLFKELNLPY